MKSRKIVVVGGGGAGIVAAIAAARLGAEVTVAERMSLLGKKVLASGAGRCNLLNETLNASFYNEEAAGMVNETFRRFGKDEILSFFRELGLWTHTEEDGRIFPLTDKALTLMDLLRAEIEKLGIAVQLNCHVRSVKSSGREFVLEIENGKALRAERVILAAGGQSYPNLGSDGSGFELARAFGHAIVPPVPITVPLMTQDVWCRVLEGQRIRGRARPFLDSKAVMPWIEGDILFTNYGLSGTAILDISDPVSVGLNRAPAKKASVALDLVPFLSENDLARELERRVARGMKDAYLVAGLLPPKFAQVLREFLVPDKVRRLAAVLKNRVFFVSGTRGWDAAEFTAGGVAISEVDSRTFESRKQGGLYLCGEVVDVNGRRGGYQLAWAWASGYLAGVSAAG
ncbi:MAG: aminoacetone oxidase family FAD-binding enzyme [Candidatus Omnitrophica bacterium]|nr:aminoacetone oxidase family FAD-binding enzyme [Candidatus Omnitrophota bacterium]